MRKQLLGMLILCLPLLGFAEGEVVVQESLPAAPLEMDDTVIIEKRRAEQKISLMDFAIVLNRPNYILPYYYTASPFQAIYEGDTPLNQRINQNEFKFQLSLLVPVVQSIMNTPLDLNISYTQMSYWQVYSSSAWFRETDYEPELMLIYTMNPNNQFGLSLNHESNGRGGTEERSWNRLIWLYTYGHKNWMVEARVWALILKANSSDLYNPNIADYLGHGDLTASYRVNKLILSLTGANFERFNRSHFQGTISYPITNKIRFYGQAYSGYGQSLIEYNHRTNAFGVGIAFNDWLS